MKTIIVVDEDASVRAKVLMSLEAAGFNAWAIESWPNISSLMSKFDPFALVVSEHFAGISGKEVVESTIKHWPSVQVVILTEDPDLAGASLRLGVPVASRFNPDSVLGAVKRISRL